MFTRFGRICLTQNVITHKCFTLFRRTTESYQILSQVYATGTRPSGDGDQDMEFRYSALTVGVNELLLGQHLHGELVHGALARHHGGVRPLSEHHGTRPRTRGLRQS